VGLRGAPRVPTSSSWTGHGFRSARAAFRRPAGLRTTWPAVRPKPRGDPPALSLPFKGRHPSPARSRAPVGAHGGPCSLSWASSTLRRTLGRGKRDDRGSRRDPRPRAGFGYPLRGTPPTTSRRAKRRSVLGLHPPGLVPRARRELLSESLPSWRYRPARRTVRCARGRGRLQGLALATGPYRHRSLGDRPSLPSWVLPPQRRSNRSGTALWSRGLPSHPVPVLTSQHGRVSGSRDADGVDGPSPDLRLSRGSSPHDCRGTPFIGVGGWLIASPRGGCTALAAVPSLFTP
jgi:hypothetical protein